MANCQLQDRLKRGEIMKKIFIILILIIAVSINIAGAKLVFTDKKTFTYNKTDEKYMKYIKYEDQAYCPTLIFSARISFCTSSPNIPKCMVSNVGKIIFIDVSSEFFTISSLSVIEIGLPNECKIR